MDFLNLSTNINEPEYWTGSFRITLITGRTFSANIIQVVVDSHAHPIWFVDDNDILYNANNIISIQKEK